MKPRLRNYNNNQNKINMALYFETAVRYDKMGENGKVKKTTEKFLVDALSFAEAEARLPRNAHPT